MQNVKEGVIFLNQTVNKLITEKMQNILFDNWTF